MPSDNSAYIQKVPGLIDTFLPASDSVLLPITKAFIQHLKDFNNTEEIIQNLDRSTAIAGWYREKFRDPRCWQFVMDGLGLVDQTPSEPQDEDDCFDALMSLQWYELPNDLRKRLSSVGYSPEDIESQDYADLMKRIRKEWASFRLSFMPSLLGYSLSQLRELIKVFFIVKAYPQFKEKVRTILLHSAPA